MKILGISAFYHDSAAALVIEGKIVAAIEEERFTRIKHDNAFPFQAIDFCLKSVDLSIDEIDAIVFYEKPLVKFERLLENFVKTYPFSLKPFLSAIPDWLANKIQIEDLVRKKIGFKNKLYYIPHHLSHAAAAFYTSPYPRAAIMTIDGVGEYQTTGLWLADDRKISSLATLDFPHSLGLLYSTFTAFLGFKVNEDEYKVMGLSAYGKPMYKDRIYKLIDLNKDGSFNLDMSYFAFREDFQMWNKRFEKLFGRPRTPKERVVSRHKDIAASIQAVTEEVYLRILRFLYSQTLITNLCISGGVALNALANGKIYQETNFKSAHILGSAGDSGGAIGGALFTNFRILKQKNSPNPLKTLYLGTSYNNEEIERTLQIYRLRYKKYDEEEALLEIVAKLLKGNKIIGWFQDKTEFGPRALGARSILAKPNPASMKEKVNRIKRREQFRPFAGSILQEQVHNYFLVPEKNHYSPFMNFCFLVKRKKRQEIVAIVHKDNTCRIQTVNPDNGRYYRLIKKYYDLTGSACVLNTSFNLKGEPIVEHPRQAIEDFLKTEMDSLVLNDFLACR